VEGERVYVADRHNNRVAIFGMDGRWVGSVGSGQLGFVVGVAVDKEGGRLAVTSQNGVHLFIA
jgi:DNA-binding beta-propeller fold protein YncE